MSNELQANHAKNFVDFPKDKIDLIKNTVCKGASDNELSLFLHYCKRTGLDPLARQIYGVTREVWDKETKTKKTQMSIQTSIDGFRLIADRSGKYAGQLGPFWCGNDGKWVDVWLKQEPPLAAKIGVIRTDFKEPVWAIARFWSYAQTYNDKQSGKPQLNTMWQKMGDHMIAKCAESLALRKAFPQELSGLYSDEEMNQVQQQEPSEPILEAKTTPIQQQQQTNLVPIGPDRGKPLTSLSVEIIQNQVAWLKKQTNLSPTYASYLKLAEQHLESIYKAKESHDPKTGNN